MTEQIIQQAAEAIIIKQGNNIIKRRIKKSYRLEEIDNKLRKQKTKKEAKLLDKLKNIINVPKLIKVKENEIIMQFINGKKLSENLESLKNKEKIMKQLGEEISKLHNNNIIHGDLTTSNMILLEKPKEKNQAIDSTNKLIKQISQNAGNLTTNEKINNSEFKIFLIDFGLSFSSHRIEDKAVDLHLLRQALESKHFSCWKKLFNATLKGYNAKDKKKIMQQLEKVEARGRYKH